MKKILMITAVLFAASLSAFAQTDENRDLLSDLEDKIISERKERKAKKADKLPPVQFRVVNDFSYGWTYVNGTGYPSQLKSHEVEFNFATIRVNVVPWLAFDLGFGNRWNTYYLNPDKKFGRGSDGNITVENRLLTESNSKAYLRTYVLTVPLSANFHFGDFNFAVGAEAVFNMPKSTKTINEYWSTDMSGVSHNVLDTVWGGNVTPVTADFFASVNYSLLGAFVRYSPFQFVPGQDFKTLTVGVRLNLWTD